MEQRNFTEVLKEYLSSSGDDDEDEEAEEADGGQNQGSEMDQEETKIDISQVSYSTSNPTENDKLTRQEYAALGLFTTDKRWSTIQKANRGKKKKASKGHKKKRQDGGKAIKKDVPKVDRQ